MTPLRFRAWHKAKGLMKDVQAMRFNSTGVRVIEVFVADEINLWLVEDCVVMQNTALKDRNGKEIFEGDIVEWGKRVHKGPPSIVKWDGEMSRFHVYRGDTSSGYIFEAEAKWSEVIGNIFENPDLLPKDA